MGDAAIGIADRGDGFSSKYRVPSLRRLVITARKHVARQDGAPEFLVKGLIVLAGLYQSRVWTHGLGGAVAGVVFEGRIDVLDDAVRHR